MDAIPGLQWSLFRIIACSLAASDKFQYVKYTPSTRVTIHDLASGNKDRHPLQWCHMSVLVPQISGMFTIWFRLTTTKFKDTCNWPVMRGPLVTVGISFEGDNNGPLTRYVKLRITHAPGTFSPYPEPVCTGWSSVHWNATGWPSVHWDTTGPHSEYLQGTLEHHWKNLVETAPHWNATGET